MAGKAAVVLALLPMVWIGSVAWSTALTAGLLAHEVGRRVRRALG